MLIRHSFYANGCPGCLGPLHYSNGSEEYSCPRCFWTEGDPRRHKEYPLSLADWHVMVGLMYAQLKAKKLSYEEYSHFIEYDVEIVK